MKDELNSAAGNGSVRRFDRGQVVGLTVIAVTVLIVSAWLSVQDGSAVRSSAMSKPAIVKPIADARFDSNAWRLPNDESLGFVEVSRGVFTIGSDPSIDPAAYDNERWSQAQRQGRIEVGTFYIGRYEVTVGQFAAFVENTQRPIDSQTLRAPANHPVTHVTWADALAYARWLESELEVSKQTPSLITALLHDGWRITLPSEAQWEKAARGTDGRIYPWGNLVNDTHANFGRSGTAPVGAFACPPCAFGLADMSGNVWELTRSPFQTYPWDAADEAANPRADALFVMRGGAYNDAPNTVRAAIRGGIDPGARRAFIGFRLVLEKPAQE